jgi:hypothetical protein
MEKNKMKKKGSIGTFCAQIECSNPLGHQASHIRSLNWIE